MKLLDVILILRTAVRCGAEEDAPEGNRYIKISDTLANQMADAITNDSLDAARHLTNSSGVCTTKTLGGV